MKFLLRMVISIVLTGLCITVQINAQGDIPSEQASSLPQGSLGAQVDDAMSRFSAFGFSGAILIAKDGKILLHRGYGLADREKRVPITTATMFDIGSRTKQFTGAAILKLEAQGKLKLTDRLGQYLKNVPRDKQEITIEELLTHTAGLEGQLRQGPPFFQFIDRQKYQKQILETALISKPGTSFSYSNLGYGLLASVIEEVSHQDYRSYIRQQIIQPAGLSHTFFWGDPSLKDTSLIARGYEFGGNDQRGVSWAEWKGTWDDAGAGGMVSTVGDMYRFHLALMGGRVLSSEALRKFFAPYVDSSEAFGPNDRYGYGWEFNKDTDGEEIVYHDGAHWGFTCDFRWYIAKNLIIIVASNARPYGVPLSASASRNWIPALLFHSDTVMPPNFTTLDKAVLVPYAGVYELPGGETIRIWLQEEQLRIAAEGQEAIELLAPPGETDANLLARQGAQAEAIIAGLRSNDLGPLHDARGQRPIPKYIPVLQQRLQDSAKGELKTVQVLGTARSSIAGGRMMETFVRIDFAHASDVYRFFWRRDLVLEGIDWVNEKAKTWFDFDGAPYAVLPGDEPGTTPCMPTSPVNLVCFNAETSSPRTLRVDFDFSGGEVVGLTLRVDGKTVHARKIN